MNQPIIGKNLSRERKAKQVAEWFTKSSTQCFKSFWLMLSIPMAFGDIKNTIAAKTFDTLKDMGSRKRVD